MPTNPHRADPRNDDQHLWVGWDEYHRLVAQLALMVHASGWRFDCVLCLARGGLRVGDPLSRIYDLPLAILATRSYRAHGGTRQGALDIARYITTTHGELAGNVLLVDDLVDSGVTLARVQQHLTERYPAVTSVRSAVLWYKACSRVRPDYFVQYLPTSPWIHQPFEAWDTLRPHRLGAWLEGGDAGGVNDDANGDTSGDTNDDAHGDPARDTASDTNPTRPRC